MDGNNRWSKKNKCNRYIGYKKGANTLIKLSNYIFDNTDTKYISAFALSKHNLNRTNNIINILKKVLLDFLEKEINPNKKKKIYQLDKLKKNYKKNLLIYINYSGKYDVQQAALKYHQNLKENKKKLKFNDYLLTSGVPDPDILIRSGGFRRLSDFIIYQSSFTELFFLKKLWPELNINDLSKIFINYQSIERKFGL